MDNSLGPNQNKKERLTKTQAREDHSQRGKTPTNHNKRQKYSATYSQIHTFIGRSSRVLALNKTHTASDRNESARTSYEEE